MARHVAWVSWALTGWLLSAGAWGEGDKNIETGAKIGRTAVVAVSSVWDYLVPLLIGLAALALFVMLRGRARWWLMAVALFLVAALVNGIANRPDGKEALRDASEAARSAATTAATTATDMAEEVAAVASKQREKIYWPGGLVLLAGGLGGLLAWKKPRLLNLRGAKNTKGEWDALADLQSEEFQSMVLDALRGRGYTVVLGMDEVADTQLFMLQRDAGKILVSCRSWKNKQLTGEDVRALAQSMMLVQVPQGMLVGLGVPNGEAVGLAGKLGIELVTGRTVVGLLQEAVELRRRARGMLGRSSAPTCPKCGKNMVRHGSGTSGPVTLWRCASYPACRAIMALE